MHNLNLFNSKILNTNNLNKIDRFNLKDCATEFNEFARSVQHFNDRFSTGIEEFYDTMININDAIGSVNILVLNDIILKIQNEVKRGCNIVRACDIVQKRYGYAPILISCATVRHNELEKAHDYYIYACVIDILREIGYNTDDFIRDKDFIDQRELYRLLDSDNDKKFISPKWKKKLKDYMNYELPKKKNKAELKKK